MQAPDPVETILARLMPPALSEHCQAELSEMIAELAGPEPENVVPISSGKWLTRSLVGGGIAAAIGALCALYPLHRSASESRSAAAGAPAKSVLISAADRVESMTDEGWQNDANGTALRALRLQMVQENNLRDPETGLVVQISESCEKVLLLPQTTLAALRKIPTTQPPALAGNMVQLAGLPNHPNPAISVAAKSASCSSEEGKAVIQRDGENYAIRICDPLNNELFKGNLARDANFDTLPAGWRTRVQVLCRTLDQALDGSSLPTRQPQPRMAPPVTH